MTALALALAVMTAAPSAPAPLPLRFVRLYETGVGYFERAGTLDSAGVTLPLPAGHIDDALKTLVVLSKDGKVGGFEFGSSVSKGMARTLAGLPAADGPVTYQEMLATLKGAPVEVQLARERFPGRVIDVVEEEVLLEEPPIEGQKPKPAKIAKELMVLVLSDRAELRRIRTRDLVGLRATDAAVAGRWHAALDALSAPGGQAQRVLKLSGSRGEVRLGYVTETPLWRTTYRLVVDAQGKSMLQGWALVHNDTDEDWRKVKVELVNGRPDSFLFPLAAPRYARRALVAPQNALSTVPQLLGTTVDAIWGDHLDGGEGGMGMVGHGAGGGGVGYGLGLGGIGTVGHGGGTGAAEGASGLLDVGNLAQIAVAEGVEAGALFTYALPQTLDLRAHGSALVPFLVQPVEAQEITWLSAIDQPPRTAVRFVNSSSQTLPGGPIAVFAGGGFAGESALERLKPADRRFVQFGADLDLDASAETVHRSEEVQRLVFRRGSLEEHFLRHTESVYSLENRGGRGRSVWVALSCVVNAKVEGVPVDFDAQSGRPVAHFEVAARQRSQTTVKVVEGLQRSTLLDRLTSSRLHELAALVSLPDSVRRIAQEGAERQAEIERFDREQAKAQGDLAEAEGDVGRLRENLKALAADRVDPAKNPFAKRVLAAEDRILSLRSQIASLQQGRTARADAVAAALARLDAR